MKDMSIKEIIATIAAVAAVLGTFLEVSKIEINPWSTILGWIGDKMMAGVKKEIEGIKKEQETIIKKQDELSKTQAVDAADHVKSEVFRFYNECQRGERHTEAEFNYIIKLNKKYEKIIEQTHEPNGVYEMEYEWIMQLFKRCQEQKDFL